MAKNEKTKATQRNMRSKKDGSVLNANHVTLEATRKGQSHIDQSQFQHNAYWRFESDGKITLIRGGTGGFNATKHEIKRYKELFGEGQEAKNERYIKNRNKKNCRTVEELYRNPKTAPLESLWQIGNSKSNVMPTYELRVAVFKAWSETVTELKQLYGENLMFLDAGLHMEEAVPHIHSRMVLGAIDEYGHFMPNQTQAFKEMGIERPDPTKARSKYNNELIGFSDKVREMFYQNCEKQGIVIDREVRSASHRQKEMLEYQVEQLLKEVEKHREISRTAQEALEKTLGNINSLNGQIKALEAAKAALERDKLNLEERVDSLVQEKNELKTENQQLKTENRALRNDNKDLELQIADQERQEMQLTIQIQNLTREKQQTEIDVKRYKADREAALDSIRKIEEHERNKYGDYKSPITHGTIPAQKEKKNLRGQVVQEARPECTIVETESYKKLVESATHFAAVKYNQATIDEVAKALAANEVYADQEKKISDQEIRINALEMELEKANRKLDNYEYTIKEKGIEHIFVEPDNDDPEQIHVHHHHRRR